MKEVKCAGEREREREREGGEGERKNYSEAEKPYKFEELHSGAVIAFPFSNVCEQAISPVSPLISCCVVS